MQKYKNSGKVSITILEAKLIRHSNLFTSLDPYVKFEWDGISYKTETKNNGGKTPYWNERMEPPLVLKDINDNLIIRVFDEQSLTADCEIGFCCIKFSSLIINAENEE